MRVEQEAERKLVRRAHSGVEALVGRGVQRREVREAALDSALAPGATRPVGAGIRARDEEPDPFRLCFERDLDRVKHSHPWRRLAGKCQVFIAPEDDHLRTRLTHAVEVAQVATGIARVSGLCVPLTEAIALAHDCGHGPAGHASEEAFSPYVRGRLRPCRLRRRRHSCALEPLCRDPRRRPQPFLAAAGAVDAGGRGRRLGRPDRVRLPRLRRCGARGHPRAVRPPRISGVRRRHQGLPAGRRLRQRGVRGDRHHRPGRHDRARGRRARRVPGLQLRPYLPAARGPAPSREGRRAPAGPCRFLCRRALPPPGRGDGNAQAMFPRARSRRRRLPSAMSAG